MWALQSTTLTGSLPRSTASHSRLKRLITLASSNSSSSKQETAAAVSVVPPPPAASAARREVEQQQQQQQQQQRADLDPATLQMESSTPAPQPAAASAATASSGPAVLLSSEAWGKLCLLGVAMLWGSYNPMLRLLYSQDGPPGPVAVMLFRGVLQAMVLVAAYSYSGSGASKASASSGDADSSNGSGDASSSRSSVVPAWLARISPNVSPTAVGATELGVWLFLATGVQTLGLQLTTATRAGFLIQATALLTPLLASFAGHKPSRNVWAGCIVALVGCITIAADASATDGDVPGTLSLGGDAAILTAAFFFSLATVRLGTYARAIPAVELAAGKSLVLGGAALATFVVTAAAMLAAGEPLTDLWPSWDSSLLGWAVLCYSALGPGALAAFLHAKGQSVVPPADAQVIFSSVPIWSVAFAFLLLGGEPMSEKTVLGGVAIVAAGLIASRKDDGEAAAAVEEAAPSQTKAGKQV